jgi:hypothetical protein
LLPVWAAALGAALTLFEVSRASGASATDQAVGAGVAVAAHAVIILYIVRRLRTLQIPTPRAGLPP